MAFTCHVRIFGRLRWLLEFSGGHPPICKFRRSSHISILSFSRQAVNMLPFHLSCSQLECAHAQLFLLRCSEVRTSRTARSREYPSFTGLLKNWRSLELQDVYAHDAFNSRTRRGQLQQPSSLTITRKPSNVAALAVPVYLHQASSGIRRTVNSVAGSHTDMPFTI